jgi:hypothetical protein
MRSRRDARVRVSSDKKRLNNPDATISCRIFYADE